MSFFDSFFSNQTQIEINNINELYKSLDAKSTHAGLRTVQQECLDLLDEKINEPELILKLSTGSGKTTLGLLYLKFYAHKYKEPVLFLVANTQLVDQVLSEASSLGIKAFHYGPGMNVLEAAAMSGEMVIVSTYEKLFNGKNTFERYNITPCAMVFDDAHTGSDLIKKQYSISGCDEIYNSIKKILEESCKKYDEIKWNDLDADTTKFEVPYWIWQNKYSEILEYLKSTEQYKFNLPLIKNEFMFSRCVLSSKSFEIAPDIINIKENKAYFDCKHKLFMSATFTEYDSFIRNLALNKEVVKHVIAPDSDKGVGERMILVPSLIDSKISKQEIIDMCADFSNNYSVFVLTSSFLEADIWIANGGILLNSENIQEELDKLKDKSSKNGLYIIAQRFEGLDLADDLCRILVIDGIPHGERLIENYDAENLSLVGGQGQKNIYRIEQGMGRAVRSPVDFAAVLLIGNELSSFMARKESRIALSVETLGQLNLGEQLCASIAANNSNYIEMMKTVINGCLKRDNGWKSGYQLAMKAIKKDKIEFNLENLEIANLERKFYEASYINQYFTYNDSFNNLLNSMPDSKEKGKLWESYARVVNIYNPILSQNIQNKAKNIFSRALKPLTLLPKNVVKKPTEAAVNVSNIIQKYENLNGLVLELNELKDNFGFDNSNSKIIERNFKKLGMLLGADASNPEDERNIGSDILWFLENNVFVIEAKHNKHANIHKNEAAQLSHSINWAKEEYPPMVNIIPVMVTDVTAHDLDTVIPSGTFILNKVNTFHLIDKLIKFYLQLIVMGGASTVEVEGLLKANNLASSQLCHHYFVDYKKVFK